MLLAIDIGNTNIALGGFSDSELCFVARISTDASKTADEYASVLLNTLSLYKTSPESVTGAIVSCHVVFAQGNLIIALDNRVLLHHNVCPQATSNKHGQNAGY